MLGVCLRGCSGPADAAKRILERGLSPPHRLQSCRADALVNATIAALGVDDIGISPGILCAEAKRIGRPPQVFAHGPRRPTAGSSRSVHLFARPEPVNVETGTGPGQQTGWDFETSLEGARTHLRGLRSITTGIGLVNWSVAAWH